MTNYRKILISYSFLLFSTAFVGLVYFYLNLEIFAKAFPEPMGASIIAGLSIFLSFNTITLLYAGFVASLHNRFKNIIFDERSMIGSLGLAQGVLLIMDASDRLNPEETFFVTCVFQTWSSYLYIKHACSYLKQSNRKMLYIPHATAAFMVLFALGAFALRNWYPFRNLLTRGLIWQGCALTAGFIAALIVDQMPSKLEWTWSGLRKLLTSAAAQQNSLLRKRVYVASHLIPPVLLIAIACFGELVLAGLTQHFSLWVVAGFSPLFIPALIFAWSSLREQAELNSELSVSSRLAGSSAVRLLKRNIRLESSWAAALGIRTAVFAIDHDPDNAISETLPSSIVQIRNEEIQRCIGEFLKTTILHHHTSGQRIYGALDAERSARPCIDVIKLFACLYLDACPLIERRINGLGTLLPILDPGLAEALKSRSTATLLQNNQWFFHFDYHWVDQHLINTPNSTRYGVHLDPLGNDTRHAMMTYLHQTNGLGSFLWLGREAHERLMQEAPMLIPIIEPVNLKRLNGSEILVFILKFENLIPRLQRYFDLDNTRKVMMDYEPGVEASKLINIFKVQSIQATTSEAMINLVESIASYPWRGFKEKDQALKIVLSAHQFSAKVIENSHASGQPVPRTVLKLREAILAGVEKIGYPAQILHVAQMNKIAQRDMQSLLKYAVVPNSDRFEESWTLLSSIDLRRCSRAERFSIAKFFQDDRTMKEVLERREIHSKSIDAIVNLMKSEHHLKDESTEPEETLSSFSNALAQKDPSPEVMTLLVDGFEFLSQLFGRNMTYILTENPTLDAIARSCENGSTSFRASLWSRWIELQQKTKTQRTAA